MRKGNEKQNKKSTESRKAEHVELVVRQKVSHRNKQSGFDALDFSHNALPEIAFDEIDLSSSLLGHGLQAPVLISSMTGGYAGALDINRALGTAAEKYGLALGIGSGRQALESKEHHQTFSIARTVAPSAFIFANMGAFEVARLDSANNIDQLHTLIDLLEANALAVHLNPLQELLQPEGARDFRGVLTGIEHCVKQLRVPIIVKEVGSGISAAVAQRLIDAGVHAIDVAGAGGTSWAGVEILRNNEMSQQALDPFWDWGIPTVESLEALYPLKHSHNFTLIASGGIRNGLDIAKSIALGADGAGIARPLIQALMESGETGLFAQIETFLYQLRAVMFLTGSATIAALRNQPLHIR